MAAFDVHGGVTRINSALRQLSRFDRRDLADTLEQAEAVGGAGYALGVLRGCLEALDATDAAIRGAKPIPYRLTDAGIEVTQ